MLSLSRDGHRAALFRAALVGLGAVGVVSTVTLQLEPAYNVRMRQTPLLNSQVMKRWDELAASADYVKVGGRGGGVSE